MDSSLVLAVVGLTSLGAYLAGTRALALPRTGLRHAAGFMLETIGLTLAFSVLNLAAGFSAVLLLRALTGGFVSLYVLDDVTWLILSLLQALVFQRWREAR
jgi:hypothetical protein